MIYVSTGLIKKRSTISIIEEYLENGITNIELSGGEHDPEIFQKLKKFHRKVNFMLHNYFPPPKIPFTLNLATLNKDKYEVCKQHVLNSITMSAKLEIPFYSFHAGFLIDPEPAELGKKISIQNKNDEKIATEVFLERVNFFGERGKKEGVKILVENNVINKQNFDTFKGNPLMMTSIDQTEKLIQGFSNDVNILLDLAHLQVSSKTLNFSPVEYLKKFDHRIKAYHLSDNEGEFDTNDPIKESSWFWDHLKKDKEYFTLELKTIKIDEIKNQINMLEKFLN